MPKTAIIIPCYNEEKRLNSTLISEHLSRHADQTIFFVNDGSTDHTRQLLQALQSKHPAQVNIHELSKRSGKAEAVRQGLLQSITDPSIIYHGYLDADLAVSLEEFTRLVNLLATSGKQFILGSRIKKIGSTITRNEFRHFYGRFIATLVGYITRLDVYDTQCSAKIFHRDLVPSLTSEVYHTNWLFDVELIDRIRKSKHDLDRWGHEEPLLNWKEVKGSKLRWYNFPKILRELFILRKYCRKK